MKVYIYGYTKDLGAGHWIYKGYQEAWRELGYEVSGLSHENYYIDSIDGDYIIMVPEFLKKQIQHNIGSQ